jgi:hypothetical protein
MKQITHLLSAFIVLTTALPTLANFLVVEGRLTEAGGLSPIEESSVTFILDVLSPGPEACRLYRESHTLNMSGSRGYFNLKLGDGVRSGTGFANEATLRMALDNGAGTLNSLTCQSGTSFTPAIGNHRLLRISYDLGAGPQVLGQNIEIGASGYALSAEKIDGINATDLLTQREDAGFLLNQGNLETVFTDTNYPELLALLNGTSSTYLSSMPAANFSMNSNRITDLNTPVDPNDAANKNYVDSTIGGLSTDPSLASLSVAETGHILKWNGTQWVSEAPITEDNTKLALAGGTMTGNIDMSGNSITGAGQITGGSANFTGPLAATGNLIIGGNTDITGDAIVNGGIGVSTGINSDGAISIYNRAPIQLGDGAFGSSFYVGFRAPLGLSNNTIWTLPDTDGSAGQVLETDGAGALLWRTLDAVGESNTASNIGAGGVGVFVDKDGVDLRFRNISAASSKVTVTANANNIDVDVAEANLDAGLITNTPAGDIGATNIQAAINELDTEKVAKSGDTMTGDLTLATNNALLLGDAGANYVGFVAPATVSASQIWTLPIADGAANQVLQTNGLGVLSWVDQTISPPVVSVFGRDGAVLAQPGDYSAELISLDSTLLNITSIDVQGAVGELDSRMVTAEGNITSLQGDVATAQTDITNLGTRVTATEGHITTLQGQITTANTNISDLDGRVTVNEGAITALDTNKLNRAGDTMSGNLTLDDREVRFTSGGANFVGLRAPAGLSADQVWILPDADGSSGQLLQTNGLGQLSWVTSSATGDNLGDHIATQNIDAGNFSLLGLNMGTAAAPSISFNGSSNSGIFSPAANEFAVSVSGTEALRVNLDGFLGIGRSNPTAPLHVQGIIQTAPMGVGPGETGTIKLQELDANGLNTVGFRAPDSITSSIIWTLPTADGAPGQALQTDSFGVLSWGSFATSADLVSIQTDISNINGQLTNKLDTSGGSLFGPLQMMAPVEMRDGHGIRFMDSGGSNNVQISAPLSVTPYNLVLPGSQSIANQVLQNDGAGNLSWTNLPEPDNLGNHMAIQDLDMSSFNIINAADVVSSAMVSGNQIIANDGSTIMPAFRFQSSPDTGIFSPSVDSIALGTAGAQRLTINAMGLTGVGTAAPQARLHVEGALLLGDDAQPCNMDSVGALRKNSTGQTVEICHNEVGVYNWVRLVKEKTCPIGWIAVGAGQSKMCIRTTVTANSPAMANQVCSTEHPQSHHCSIQEMKRLVIEIGGSPFPMDTIASDITYNSMTPAVPRVSPQGEPESQTPISYGQTGTYNAPCCF